MVSRTDRTYYQLIKRSPPWVALMCLKTIAYGHTTVPQFTELPNDKALKTIGIRMLLLDPPASIFLVTPVNIL